ncbi:hypothetical protein BaRGS_00022787 [Batillaria attramentaria]|uniref:Uncharacterized protein n=1 Tax=Batillaria attramentaria TaxID=370345 RepID=A0ABD0KFG7_9CAEN
MATITSCFNKDSFSPALPEIQFTGNRVTEFDLAPPTCHVAFPDWPLYEVCPHHPRKVSQSLSRRLSPPAVAAATAQKAGVVSRILLLKLEVGRPQTRQPRASSLLWTVRNTATKRD